MIVITGTGVRGPSRRAAKALILDIIAAAHGELRGATRLNKAFYFAHLLYWQTGDGVLTDYPIVRMPNGPGVDDYQALIDELVREGEIQVAVGRAGPYPESVYRLTTDRTLTGDAARTAAIRDAVNLVKRRPAAELSELLHAQSRVWQETPNGHELNIYSDLITDEELSRIRREIAAFREAGRSGRHTS